jgi:hypothetical protein
MPFDSNISDTKVYDYTENDNDGTLNNGTAFVSSGMYGGAYEFDGIDDNIYFGATTPPSLIFKENFTLSAWVKLNDPSNGTDGIIGTQYIHPFYWNIFHGRQYFYYRNSTGKQQAVLSSTTVIDTNWHYVAVVLK